MFGFSLGSGDWISILVLVRRVAHRTVSLRVGLFAERQLSLHSRAEAALQSPVCPTQALWPTLCTKGSGSCRQPLRPAEASCALLGFASSFLQSFPWACCSSHASACPSASLPHSYLALSCLEISVPWPHSTQLRKEVSAGTQCWTQPSPQSPPA